MGSQGVLPLGSLLARLQFATVSVSFFLSADASNSLSVSSPLPLEVLMGPGICSSFRPRGGSGFLLLPASPQALLVFYFPPSLPSS